MKLLHNLKLGVKLPLMLVTIALVALTIMGGSAYREARNLLEKDGAQRLTQALDDRRTDLEAWAAKLMADARAVTDTPATNRALREMSASWKRLGDAPGAYLRKAYIEDNPNPKGARHKLDYPGDVTDYSILHRRYHPGFVTMAMQMGFADIYMINTDGVVVYSMGKNDDFATDLLQGPYKGGALAQVAKAALTAGDGAPVVSEFAQREAGRADDIGLFIAAPLRNAEGMVQGVIAFEVSVAHIDATLANVRGLGETGQGYLVSVARVLQNDLRLSKDKTLLQPVEESPAIRAAFAGESGIIAQTGIAGQPVVAAFAPVHLFGRHFAAVVEQSAEEMFAPAHDLARSMLFNAAWLMALLLAMSWGMARSVAAPLQMLGGMIRKISGGDRVTPVAGTQRSDEVGHIACALEALRTELQAADSAQLQAAMQGTAFESCSAAMMMVDKDFNIIYTNRAFLKMVTNRLDDFRTVTADIIPDELIGRSMDAFHKMPERARKVLSDPANLPYHADIVVGAGRFGLDVSEIVLPGKGQIGFVVEWRDVTELRMNRALLNALDANQLLCEFTPAGLLSRANANMCAALGEEEAALLGRRHDVFFHDDGVGGELWARLQKFEPIMGRFVLPGAGDRQVIVEGSVTPVPDRNNRMLKIVLIGNDITEAQHVLKTAEERNAAMMAGQQAVVEALRVGLTKLSDGDLCARIDAVFSSDYEQLRADFNAAVNNLAQAMQVVIDNATAIDSEAQEISNAAEDLSRRTEKQAATLEQTAAALDQLTSSVTSATEGATEAERVVREARVSAEASGEIVQQAVAAMGEIEESSQKISRIISVIDDIAFQTNLLALNAGVEAARAGEAGRGFAVVASEVRALAQRSSEAAREIDALISASSGHVRRGVDLVGETGRALTGILGSVIDVAARVSQVAASSREQASGLAEINVAVNQLDQVTQQNAAMFEQTTAASHALNRGAQSLTATTSMFRTPDARPVPAQGPKVASKPAPRVVPASKPAEPSAAPPPAPMAVTDGNTLRKPMIDEDEWEDF